MASSRAKSLKDSPLIVVNTFKDHGWWISRDDKQPILLVSDFAWEEKGVWCASSFEVGQITKVLELDVEGEGGYCEVFIKRTKSDEPSSFILQTKNLIRSYRCLGDLKFTGLPKYKKWWDQLNLQQKDIREKLVDEVSLMDSSMRNRMKLYMAEYERKISASSLVDAAAEFLPGENEDNLPFLNGLSFYKDRRGDALAIVPIASREPPTLRRKKAARRSQSHGDSASCSIDLDLSQFDFETPPLPSRQTLGRVRGNVLLSTSPSATHTTTKEKLVLPTAQDIDSGYIFGRDHLFYVDISKVRPTSNILTNQRVLNISNAEAVYKHLRENVAPEANVMALRPMEYLPVDSTEPYIFKTEDTKTDFMACLNSMPFESPEDKRDNFLPLVIWEPVDGQHILHACQVFAPQDQERGAITKVEFDRLFSRRPTQVLAYEEEYRYLVASCKKNEDTTERIYHSTVGEALSKTRAVWKKFGSPNAQDEEDVEKRRLFLQCLPSITGLRLGKDLSELTISWINSHFRDYISLATVGESEFHALEKMCESYDNGLSFHTEKACRDAQLGSCINTKSKSMKPAERPRMAITWLRPLQGTSTNDFIFLCEGATVSEEGQEQQIFFAASTKSSSELDVLTLPHLVERAKLRNGIYNALKWLDAEAAGTPIEKKNWLSRNVQKYGNAQTLDFLGRDATKDFKKKWIHVKDFTSFDAMEKHIALIPSKVRIHMKFVSENKLGLFADGKEVFIGSEGLWTMEFNFTGMRSEGIDLVVKVGENIFSQETGKFTSPALWVFECRKGPTGVFWKEAEYSSIMGIISSWMENIPRWNAIFLLPANEDANKVIKLLDVKNNPGCHVNIGYYAFAPQCQTIGSLIKDGARVVASYDPIGAIIYVIHHPPTAPIVDNLAQEVRKLGSFFIEPQSGWDICSKDRHARCPAVVDEIISSYIRPESWMIVAHGFSHMMHTLAGKAREVVIFEPNEDMATWLRRWKRQIVDGILPLEEEEGLWEDGEVDSENEEDDARVQTVEEISDVRKKRMKHTDVPREGEKDSSKDIEENVEEPRMSTATGLDDVAHELVEVGVNMAEQFVRENSMIPERVDPDFSLGFGATESQP